MSEQQTDWHQVKIGELLTEHSERSTSSNQHEVLSVTKDGIFSQREYFKKQIASEDNSGYKVVRRGDVVFSAMNLWMGSIDVVKDQEIGIVSPAYITMRPTEGLIDTGFLSYFLRGDEIRKKYVQHSQQGASIVRRNLNKDDLLDDEVCIPPLPEQKKIAEILSGIDSTISAADRKLQKLSTARSKVSEDILATSNSDLCRVPLCNCIELVRGYAFKSEDYREKEGTRILRVTNIKEDGKIDLTKNCVRISEDLEDQYNRFQVKEDDLLLVMVGATTGKLGVASNAEIPSLLNQNIWCLRTSSPSTIIQKYLHYSMPKVVSKHLEKQQGSARDFLTQKEFFKEEIEIPNLAVQVKIVQAMGQIDKSIDATKGFKERLLFLKSAISSDLLSGRKRVSV